MTVKELYEKMDEMIPTSLSCEWDNDGLMCSADTSREVKKVLCVLDVTMGAVNYARDYGFDLIISHHPLIFNRLSHISDDDYTAKKVIALIKSGISVFSFHTRADMFFDGVNERLANILGLSEVEAFGPQNEKMGRIGYVPPTSLESFAKSVKKKLSSPMVLYSGSREVNKVAVLGGDGKDFVKSAIEAGADTYISGRIGYNITLMAEEMGINLIEAGHYHTEKHISDFYLECVKRFLPNAYCEVFESNTIRTK